MKKILVLGGGMVGSAIIRDLAKDYSVIVIDRNKEVLETFSDLEAVKTISGDVTDSNFLKIQSSGTDIIVSAVPGFLGFKTLENIIALGKNVVDISFFSEDPFELDELAIKKNVTAVVDCGIAPGMSNIILGWHNKLMDIKSFECLVGGLPFKRSWPFQYKAPFSPIDVIEEYTRPARIVQNGKIIVKPALSGLELVDIPTVGTLEAFNTDGLRSLLKTMKIPDMKEKTLRYPGHTEYMKMLRETGFFDSKEINVNGKMIAPLALTSKLLFPLWKLEKDEEEFTVLKIIIHGKEGNKEVRYEYNLFDQYDSNTKTSSMARSTGYTCTAVVRQILKNNFNRVGICPPEYIGAENNCFSIIMEEVKSKGINYSATKEEI